MDVGVVELAAHRPEELACPAIAAGAHDQLAAAFQKDVLGWRKNEMAMLLSRGIARGDVRADVPVEITRELGQSVLWHRLLITGDPIDDTLVVQLVDEVLVPFVSPRYARGTGIEAPKQKPGLLKRRVDDPEFHFADITRYYEL
jgi:hypothetical protein